MRIWAFPSFYPFDYPGERWRGIFAHRQYKGLVENGADLKVIQPILWKPPYPFSQLSSRWQGKNIRYPHHRVMDGIEIFHPVISNHLPHALDKRSFAEKFYDSVVGLFKELGIKPARETDIFYSQWLPDSVSVQYTAHRLGLKSAILSIGDDVVVWPFENDNAMRAFKDLELNADMRFACADYLGREANRIVGKDLPYEVVNWGADYDLFKPVTPAEKANLRKKLNLPADKLVILNVGTAIVRKGWLDLFDALQIIRDSVPDFLIVAVHAGKPELDLDAEAARRGHAANFLDLGEIPPEVVREVFNAADIFCLPSHWEGLANANIEAMSSGLPVITTNVCGHPELVNSGLNGLLVPPKDPQRLSEALAELMNSPERRAELSRNGRDFIVNKWGNFRDNAKRLYSLLVGGGPTQ